MKKILIYGLTGNIGGIENYIIYQYRQFDKTLLHIDFISAYKNVQIAYYDEIIQNGSQVFDLSSRKKWKQFLLEHHGEYDTIIFNNTNPFELYMLQLVKAQGGFRRIIIHSHNSGLDQPKLLLKLKSKKLRILQNTFKIIHAELWACSTLAGKWMFGDDANFTVIKNGIDTNRFRFSEKIREETRKELGLLENNFAIGNIARFSIQKNHKFTLNIFANVLKHNPSAVLILIGQNVPSFCPLKQITEIRAKRMGIRNKIIFLGLRKDTDRIYQALDAFILPSLYEGLPVVGVEAQTAGLACFFSDKITKEVKLLPRTMFLPIEPKGDAAIWAMELNNLSINYEREQMYIAVREKGFDIKDETKKVQDMLIQN